MNDLGFPTPTLHCGEKIVGVVHREMQKDMSLRDWFAGQALASMETFTANPEKPWTDFCDAACADIACTAYKMADAMLAESRRRQDG